MISYNKDSHWGKADVNQAGVLLPKWKPADLLSISGPWGLEGVKEASKDVPDHLG